jgi:DNA adenine methylase
MRFDKQLILLRYPGGKQRQLPSFFHLLPSRDEIAGRYIEPFVGGGAVFFSISPRKATLSDVNQELIDLYRGIRWAPRKVWSVYRSFPSTKTAYYRIRDQSTGNVGLIQRAARTLYINRTCFKGMWRHNSNGDFNVGYGGQDRRWVISEEDLLAVAKQLKGVILKTCDFEEVVNEAQQGDFVFLDPPYRPGGRQLVHGHYQFGTFDFADQQRLATSLKRASKRGVIWAMTNSCHPDVLALYGDCETILLPKGTGQEIGHIVDASGEALIRSH